MSKTAAVFVAHFYVCKFFKEKNILFLCDIYAIDMFRSLISFSEYFNVACDRQAQVSSGCTLVFRVSFGKKGRMYSHLRTGFSAELTEVT